MGLCLDICANNFAACGIKGDLTCGKNKLTTADCLTIGANSCGRLVRADLYALHNYFPRMNSNR
jgi:hypothetical protein